MRPISFWIFILVISFSQNLFSQDKIDPSEYKHQLRVACIGNSITYGAGINNIPRDSYPAQLGKMLGERWNVRNYGVSGRTMLKKGDFPYWNEPAFQKAKEFLPDVVIIKLGTNDSKPQNWKYKDDFYYDYKSMIEEFLSLESNPKIYLCLPLPVYQTRWGIRDSVVNQGVIPVVEKLANEYQLPLIDLNKELSGRPELFPDAIHPNEVGARLIAETIFRILTGEEPENMDDKYPGVKSKWHGFDRYDFDFKLRPAHIIVPSRTVVGNPWVWRARFPEWHYEMDSVLLKNGFHIVYLNTDNMLGSPKAIECWDQFYRYLTSNYGLMEKVALEGVSRGGLFIYRFAKMYPERTACIYAEAPVCDFKSWPGGKGRGDGDERVWKILLKEYGFSEEEAMSYQDNPINNLEALAKSKVPIWHSIGLNDSIVPVEENSFKLIHEYIKLGGPATIYPNTEGEQSLKGHHFPVDDINAGADFIVNSCMIQNGLLNADDYHQYRDLLQNARIVFEKEKKGRVAFLGGSITYGGGWRDSIMMYLQDRFPETEFEFIQAGIPSMGSTPGAFRLYRDVLSKGKIDLLFEEAAVNDNVNHRNSEEQVRAMEGIVRHTRSVYPACDIVFMHFVDPDKMEDYRNGIEPEVIVNHEKVADYYNISSINLAKEVTDRIDSGEFSWENDFKNLHPSPFGHHIYFQSMKVFLDHCWSGIVAADDKIVNHNLPEKLDAYCYDNGKLLPATEIKLKKGWVVDEKWIPEDKANTRDDFVNVPMLICETPQKSISYIFNGCVIGVAVAAGPDAGILEYKIDNGAWNSKDLYTDWSGSYHLPWFYTLDAQLKEGKHKIILRLSENKNPASKGTACRIRYFYINR